MLGYGVSIGDSISEIEEEQRKKKPLPPISEVADLLLAADGHAVPSAPGNPGSGTSSPLPPISEAADKILAQSPKASPSQGVAQPPVPKVPGLRVPGNIDLKKRPVVHNPDNSISTVKSISVGFDDGTYLLPTITPDGRVLSNTEEAIQLFLDTGMHLGIYDSPEAADAAAKTISQGQGEFYGGQQKSLPPISEAADMLLAGVPSAPASVPAIDRSEHGNNMALNLNVPDAAKDPLHIGAAAQNAYWNLQESKGNTAAMRAFQLEQAKRENTPGEVVAVNRSGVAPMTPVEEAVMLRQMAAKDRGDTSQTAELEKSLNTRIDELKDEAKRRWASAEKGRVKYDLPDNKFGAAILQTIESSGMTVEAALRSGALWALGGPALGLMGSFVNTATEADYEAGETFVKALKAGKSPEEIQDAVNSVRVKNLALLSLTNPLGDVLLFGLGKPLKALAGKIAGKGLLAKAGRAVTERGIPYLLGAAPEGVEGGSQEAFQQQAAGQDLDWKKIKEAAGSEALASLLYGLVGRGLRGGAKVLLGGQADTADSGGGKPGEPPAPPPPASGETSQTDSKKLPSQERVRSKLLELREKIFSSYLGPDPRYKGAAPELNWDNMSAAMKKQVLRLRKAMELWDAGKYDEAERLASLLKDEMMPEKDTPLWAPVEKTDEPGAKTEGEPAQGETAEPSMPISEAADQVLAAPPETQTESGTEEKKAGTIRIGNREISIVDTDDSDDNGPTGGAGSGGIVLPGERRGRNTSMPGTDTSGTVSDTSGTVTDTSTPRERVKGTIRSQLEAIAAQGGEQGKVLGSEEIDAYSTLFAAMAEQAGKRQGISAEEWLESQNLKIVNGRPEFEMKDNSLELKQNAGENSKTAPRSALGRAKQMERAGKRSARDIYAETGWFRGPDGEWRYVIDDSKASIAPDFKNAVSKLKLKAVSKQDVTLGELLDHPDLYAAYPHLKNVKIKVDFGRAGGAYLEGNYPLSLELGTQSLTNDTKPATDDELVETLLHEIQHSIQAAEGFTRGGNLQMVQARMQALWDRKDDPDLTEEEREAARNELKKFDYDPSQKEFKPNRQTLYDAYRRIGGEAEARLTSWYRNARDKDTRLPNDAMAAMLKSEWLMRHSQDLNDILLKPKRGSLWDFGVPWSVSERDMGFGSDEIVQAISSANTSLNQIAATFRHPKFSPVDKNLDIGGGKFNKGTEFLASRGIENVIFDPYNRPSTENKAVIKRLKSGERFPTVTSNNVLNVIAEQSVRENVILQSAKALSPDGTAYFLIYEGDSSGVGKETTRGWQNNKKTNEYMNEIKKHFNNVTKSGNLLIARNPVNTNGLAAWDSSPDTNDRVFFQETGETGESSEQGPVADEVTTRGSTLFGKGRVKITLGKAMDRTTLVHEFGHLFLADLFKQAKNGVVSAIRDLNVLMSWWTQEASWLAKWISANKYGTFTAEQAAKFAGKNGAQLVRDALSGKADPDTAQVVFIAGHEMFARGFERYLSDGKAPNGQLQALFERFRTWMAEVYGKLAGDPNFKLSQDAREVMDRMVGGENAAAQAGAAENVSVARNGNETVVTLNESREDSSGREFFQKVKKKRPEEGSIPSGQEPALQTQIRPASGQALFKKDTLDSAPSQKEYTGGSALDLKTAVEQGHISQNEADFMEAMISAFPQSFQERFEVQVSPDAHPGGTSAYSIHKMGGTLEDAKHMVTLFKGGNVIDAIHGFGRFIHDRALSGSDVSIVKSTWKQADTKADRAEWFADQFTSWWIDGQTQNRGMAGVFRKMMKALKGLVDKFRGKNVLHPDMEALLNDIVTNGREISEKYFFNDADFVRKYLLGVDPDPNDWLGEGFSDNSKTFTSWDPGNLCPKKDSFIEYIVARMKKEGKTYADLVNVDLIAQWYDDALKEGIQVPCSYCYVEQARRKAIQFQQQGKSITGVRFAMAKTSIRAIPYNGALLNERRFSDKKINEMNKRGGLRMFSFSDYIRAVHRVQIGKMLRDAAKRLLSVKAITKVAEFVEDFASTGITINQSLDAMNPMFGMDWDLAVQNKEKYPNVKIRVVARNLEEFDRFWKLKYRVKPDGSIEYLDAWKTRKQDRTDQSGLPTKPAKDYEKRLAEDGWKEMVDVITPYHHDDYTSPVPKGYEDLVWDGKSMRELRRQNPDIVNRTCCQEGGKCYNAKTGEQCQCNCGLGAGNLSIPKGIPEALNEIQLNQTSIDKEYFSAIEAGDLETAQRLVDEAAERAGYSPATDYRMNHQAPNSQDDVSLLNLRESGLVPDDYWTHPQWYQHEDSEWESWRAVTAAMRGMDLRKSRGKDPGKQTIRMFRAVPKNVKENSFRNGDWITPSRADAVLEGKMIPGGYRIISQMVPVQNLYWDGNSINEFGYDDGKEYAYQDTKNNRKLLDPVTYDETGNVIPISKRFDKRSPDVFYQRTGDEKTPPNKKKQQQALTHKAKETEQARRMTNAPETPWPDEGSPISEQDIEEVFGTRSRAAKETETPWPGEGENVTEADIDEMFSEGSWSPEGFSSAVQAIDDFFTPEKKRGGGEKGPNDPKNRERYDKEGNLLSENTKEVSYLNPIYTLTSPSLLAKKNKLFAPFFKMAKEAQELQETLRRDFNAVLDKAWGNLSDDQSQALNEILIEGDLRGRTFTDEQLTARGLDEDVRRGYSLIRDLSDRVGRAVRQRQRESGTPVMGWREGYVPHIFHGFFVRLDGRIVDTARSLQEAVELARNVEKDHPGGTVDIASKPNDFSGSSAYNASALNDRKLLKFSTTMEEAFAFTPDEAETFLKGKDKGAFKNRIFAFSHERLGVKGWDQDMKFAFRHYVNQSARFLAMDELKYRGIGLFEKTWGEFNHEYKGISKYTKDYLNDVLGVPSNASTQMNEWFKRIPGMYKISKQVFGDRPAEYLASVFTKGMGVAKLGFLNIASAMMNLSQLINASALLGYNDLRRGIQEYFANLKNPSERVTRIYEETGVSENLNVAAGAGYSKASERMYGAIGRFLELSMAPFAYMDGMCRKATVLAAYNKAHREGKSHTEAIAYAKEINDRANFDYSVADTPAFLRRSGPLGQVIFQFKKFGIKQLELATGLNGFAQNARFWIPMIALSGLWGFPGADLLRALFMALFDRDPQAELNAWMAKENWISEPVRRTIQYGALSNAGVDISKRVGMGDVIPKELADLLGPTVGTIHRMAPHVATLAGKLFGLEGDGTAALLNALEALSPGLSNPIKAILGEVEDKKRGRLKFKYEGSGERAVRAMGFRPTREAVESDAVRAANYVEAKRMEREREAIDEYVRARESGSTKDAAKALARLKELKVTPDRIIRELRERKKGTAYERLQQKLKGQKSQEARKVLQGF